MTPLEERAALLREAAPGLVDRAADAARRMAGDDSNSAAIMASIVTGALWQALGCTCSDHTDEGAVYIEDLTCPMHGSIPATALERAQPLLAARFEPESDDGRVEYGAAHGTCEHWGSWPTAESLIAWLPDNPGWRPLIRVTSGAGLTLPLPPFDPDAPLELREHPGHDVPTVGIPMAADGAERTYDLGISAGTPQPLLVPTGPPRDPHAATVPFEAFVGNYPDHIDWVRDTGRCMATGPHECVAGTPTVEGQERSEEQK